MWTEQPKGKNKKPVNKDRFISKMFLRYVSITGKKVNLTSSSHVHRGDSVVLSKFLPFIRTQR